VNRPTMLVQALVKQFARDLSLSAERDLVVIRDRVEHEGLSFLTLTLPLLSDSLERGLEAGRYTCPSQFKLVKHGRLPAFLQGFFYRVFDRDGYLLPKPDVDAIIAIRQISRFFKKPKIPCSPERELEAVRRYKEVERELFRLAPGITARKDETLDRVSKIIWSQVLPEPDPYDLVCRHGPGVTADRYGANSRHRIRSWYTRSELLYPSALHAFPNYGWACDGSGYAGAISWSNDQGTSRTESFRAEGLVYHDVGCEPAVRVVFVPKTLKAPRVIAIEPASMQFIQQSLMNYIVPLLEDHPLTAGSIRFTDQSVNQRLAYLASIDRRLATLDLKDASDRVSLALVQRIFKGTPILEYLEDARSLHADLPDGSNVILNKYASMGSALCFPVEAMVFYTIIQAAIHDHLGIIPTNATIKEITHMIDIYGDDIIVPVDHADAVVRNLELYGLKVNLDKSFTTSHFRESCGGDYFAGTAVKPVYAREIPPEDGTTWLANELMSWNATRDQLYLAGLWDVVQVVDQMLEAAAGHELPRSRFAGGGLVLKSLMFDTKCFWNRDLNGWDQRRIVFSPKREEDLIDGDGVACLLKTLSTSRTRDPSQTASHLTVAKASWNVGSLSYLYERREADLDDMRLGYLDRSSEGHSFQSVTKRGVFRQKHRRVRALP